MLWGDLENGAGGIRAAGYSRPVDGPVAGLEQHHWLRRVGATGEKRMNQRLHARWGQLEYRPDIERAAVLSALMSPLWSVY